MDIQNGSLEFLNSLAIDAGLLMAVPFVALTQFVLYSLITDRPWVDLDAVDCRELPEETALQAEPAAGITHSIAGVELKRVPRVERQFRRRRAFSIES
jgi:hypothetical protein